MPVRISYPVSQTATLPRASAPPPLAPARPPHHAATQVAAAAGALSARETASRPLRIVHVLRAPVGGLFRHVLDLAAEQAARGHAVGIIADSSTGDRLTPIRFDAIRDKLALGITTLPMARQPGPADWHSYRRVHDAIAGLDLDIVHGHGAKGGAYARLARRALRARGSRIAAFYTPHGGTLNFRPGSLQSRAFLALEKTLDRWTDGLVFESAYAARIYAEHIDGAAPRRIVPNGLQPADFAPHMPNADAADFLFIGELRPVKGVDVLLKALALLDRDRPTTAVIVGSGPDTDALKAQAAELGLTGKVRFPGALPAGEAMALGRVFVVPSRAESFPYVVLEAAAAGIPLISTNVGGIGEIVAGTDTTLLPADDIAALAAAMRSARDDAPAALARAGRLRAAVADRFTVTGMTDAVLKFYRAQTAP